MGCIACVPQDKMFIVEKCGKFDEVKGAGFHCVGCPPFCMVGGGVTLRLQQEDVTLSTKSRDNVFLRITVAVQYAVAPDRVQDAYYRLTDPIEQIRSHVLDVVRSTVPRQMIDEVFESKDEIANSVKSELTKQMEEYGFHIVDALIIDIQPDAKVQEAMNQINANRRLRVATEERAESQKLEIRKRAEADAESKYLTGRGVARQRQAIIDGLKHSVQDFQTEIHGVTPKQIMDLVMITQYFGMLKDVSQSGKCKAVFHPQEAGYMAELGDEIRAGVMQAVSQ